MSGRHRYPGAVRLNEGLGLGPFDANIADTPNCRYASKHNLDFVLTGPFDHVIAVSGGVPNAAFVSTATSWKL